MIYGVLSPKMPEELIELNKRIAELEESSMTLYKQISNLCADIASLAASISKFTDDFPQITLD